MKSHSASLNLNAAAGRHELMRFVRQNLTRFGSIISCRLERRRAAREMRRQLAALDPHLLEDIGLTTTDRDAMLRR